MKMNQYDLAKLFGGSIRHIEDGTEDGGKLIRDLSERDLWIIDAILEALEDEEPVYEPEENELEVRLINLIFDLLLDIEQGTYDGKTFFIIRSWSTVEELNKGYYERYHGSKNVLRQWDNWGFSDEYARCEYNGGGCGNVIRTSPDCYGWQPDFWQSEWHGLVCSDCLEDPLLREDYLKEHQNANTLVNTSLVNPGGYGWVTLDFEFEHGWHVGQRDDPLAIIEVLWEKNGIDLLFSGNVGQFDVQWVVWVRPEDVERATEILGNANTQLPYDPGTELGKALRGEKSDVYQMRTYTLTPEEFVEDKKVKEIMEGKHD